MSAKLGSDYDSHMARKKMPIDVKQLLLHECGYRCANPACKTILTLDMHHIEPVGERGNDDPSNLLPLCSNCHDLHHRKVITLQSVRAWKQLLLALNEAFDKRQAELLLMLDKLIVLWITSDSVISFAGLLASGMVYLCEGNHNVPITHYHIALTEKGSHFVSGWKTGDQAAALSYSGGEMVTVLPHELGRDIHFGERSGHARVELMKFEHGWKAGMGERDTPSKSRESLNAIRENPKMFDRDSALDSDGTQRSGVLL